jgi:hypothetical protein
MQTCNTGAMARGEPAHLLLIMVTLSGIHIALIVFGTGLAIAAIAFLVRKLTRRDHDSSFTPEEFILEEAVVTVPVAPGLKGKAELQKYGAAIELYITALDGDQAFARGSRVRIIDFLENCYLVESADEEHLVH